MLSFVFQHQVRHSIKRNEHLWNLKIAHTSPHEVANINILIDLNNYYSLITGKTIKGKINEPIAINSFLSWVTCGNYQNKNWNSNTLCNFFVRTKTSFDQFETKDFKTLFDKTDGKDDNYQNYRRVTDESQTTTDDYRQITDNYKGVIDYRRDRDDYRRVTYDDRLVAVNYRQATDNCRRVVYCSVISANFRDLQAIASIPTNIFLFKVNKRNTRKQEKSVKYVQS